MWRAILGYTLSCPLAVESTLIHCQAIQEAQRARWGVVQPVGHLTVNEDGEGSNPSAPANPPETARFIFSVLTKYSFSNN